MKKLMIATAALCAAVSTYGLESANTVGYMGKALVDGNQMIGASFVTVGTVDGDGDACIKLSTIKPKGYEAVQDLIDQEGTWGDFSFVTLDGAGNRVGWYAWNQDYDTATDSWLPGVWNDVLNNVDITGEDAEHEVLLKKGDGIWFNRATDFDLSGTTLESSGEAVIDAQDVALVDGNQALAMPVSFDVKLSKVKPAGYEAVQDLIDQEGTWGDFSFITLNGAGNRVGWYSWNQDYDASEGKWLTGQWFDEVNNIAITGEDAAHEVTFAPGDGIWFNRGTSFDLSGTTLSFPGLDD